MPEPIGQWGEFHNYPPLESATIAGGVAGNLVLNGIRVGDTLKVVQNVAAAGPNLASEFSIVAAGDAINNAGGTNTTGMILLVLWYKAGEGLTGQS